MYTDLLKSENDENIKSNLPVLRAVNVGKKIDVQRFSLKFFLLSQYFSLREQLCSYSKFPLFLAGSGGGFGGSIGDSDDPDSTEYVAEEATAGWGDYEYDEDYYDDEEGEDQGDDIFGIGNVNEVKRTKVYF